MVTGDTIAALATAPGRGGVAVIRVSGADAFSIARQLTGRAPEAGRIQFARLKSPASPTIIDEAVVLAFKSPHSYTGEDVIEFQCHGGSITPRRVLEAAFAAGARLARRGEFTQRAFLNGRLDYAQAESVLNLIDAKTERAADHALDALMGRRQRETNSLYEEALSISVELEHALDFDESELPDDFFPGIEARISHLNYTLLGLLKKAHEGRILREGALVVLAGQPNAGKSSLMNALVEENRAIVSDVPGTTRDSIEVWLDLGGWPIRLVDTAGLRKTEDPLEAEGVKRAEALVAKADVVIRLNPPEATRGGSSPIAPNEIFVSSKCDIRRGDGLNISVKTGEGLPELKNRIVALVKTAANTMSEYSDFDGERTSTLQNAANELRRLDLTQIGKDLVLVGNALRTVAEKLGALQGRVYSADLLDRLFSRFCVGK